MPLGNASIRCNLDPACAYDREAFLDVHQKRTGVIGLQQERSQGQATHTAESCSFPPFGEPDDRLGAQSRDNAAAQFSPRLLRHLVGGMVCCDRIADEVSGDGVNTIKVYDFIINFASTP